ncbi:MAG: transglutaminase TgpA family protein [Anaerolineae bacterium]
MATRVSPTPRPLNLSNWFMFTLVLGAALCLSLVILTSAWLPEAGRLTYAVIWASIAGVLLARSSLPGWLAWILGIVLGIAYSIVYAGKLVPDLGAIYRDLSTLVAQGRALVSDTELAADVAAQTPFARSLAMIASRSRMLVANASVWLNSVRAGVDNRDNTALWFGATFLSWMLTWNAAFQLFRRKNTFAAFLPLGLGVSANVAFTTVGIEFVYVFLGITLVALVWAESSRREHAWQKRGLDYSPELKRDTMIAGISIAAVVLVLGILMPYITYGRAAWAFWDLVSTPLESFYDKLDHAFAGRNPIDRHPDGGEGLASHDLGTGSHPSSDVVFNVVTSDPPPPPEETMVRGYGSTDPTLYVPKHYWRQRTYDVYTGKGWETSGQEAEDLQAEEPWDTGSYPGTALTQTYTLIEPSELAYAVNEPVSIDKSYRALLRGAGDVAALTVSESEYTVTSLVPNANEDLLRAAEGEYPGWVSARHLQLPRIPNRIAELTEDIVQEAGAVTRYDKARAIEEYLRDYAYDLNVAPPSGNTDFVDYFLFTSKRGFCDYSASAMVVMLRTQGIAARYASGFGMGSYDYTQRAWVVREENSHAWAEVYFPGYGWIEFEPTPTERLFNRAGSSGGGFVAPPPEPDMPLEVFGPQIPTIYKWAAGVFALLLFVLVWPPRWFRRRARTPRAQVFEAYGQLVRRARTLGLGPIDGMTANEYLAALVDALEERSPAAEGSAELIALIGRTYQRARYGGDPLSFLESHRVEDAWQRLNKIMKRLWWLPKSRRRRVASQEV